MYQIIRASSDWQVVIVTQEEPNQEVKFLLYSRFAARGYFKMDIGELEKLADQGQTEAVFAEIPEDTAIGYFSGIADGLGFGEIPQEPFDSLGEVWAHIRKKQREGMVEFYLKYGHRLKGTDRYALLDALMNSAPLTAEEFKERLARHGLSDRWPEFEIRYHDKFRPV